LQDDWRVLRNLTLNLSMRWEYQTPWSDRFNQLGYFDPDFTDPLTRQRGLLRFTGRDGNSRYQTDPDRNNLAPRVGLAWQFHRNNRGRRSAIDARTTRHDGYAKSQRKRPLIEKVFGWLKPVGGLRKVKLRGLEKVGWLFQFTAAAFNLWRIPKREAAA
jgi:hypothetical protein